MGQLMTADGYSRASQICVQTFIERHRRKRRATVFFKSFIEWARSMRHPLDLPQSIAAITWERGHRGVPGGAAPLGCRAARTERVSANCLSIMRVIERATHAGGQDVRAP